MAHFRSIFYLIGWLILILAGAMTPSFLIDFVANHPDYKIYLLSQAIMVFLGVLLVFSNKSGAEIDFDKRDSFLLTAITWMFGIGFSSIPFLLSSIDISYTDAFFETVSGLTTTGATILRHLDTLPRGILFWRAMLQWLGGIGIIVMALTLLTDMRVGGLELFQSESSDRSEKFLPRIAQIAKVIFITYLSLTVLCFLALITLQLNWFDALCHSLTTISTGGFSTHDESIGFFNNKFLEYVLVLFMFLGGVTQLLFGHLFTKNWKLFFKDDQIKTYSLLTLSFIVMVVSWNVWTQKSDYADIITKSVFNVVSAVTTTGFCSADYALWGGIGTMVFFFAPFIGGCTGSTAGGIKVFRFQVLWRVTFIYLQKLRRPHGVFLPKYNGKQISGAIFDSVAALVILFIFCFVLLSFSLSLCGLDFITTLSASSAMLTNLGTGLGAYIGPNQPYAELSLPVKWILMGGMLLGRLELVTILILLLPSFWKD
ncbi:MAG: TrkH family potassium uptake protein [Alphaproteobacteria bacterium]